MIAYFLKSLTAHFRAGRSLYVLTVLGVALGVASVLGIQIINRNSITAFTATLDAVSGDADVSVVGVAPGFDERLLNEVLNTPGVETAWPLVRLQVAVETHPSVFLEIIGFDFFTAVTLPFPIMPTDPGDALSRRGWVAVTPALAAELGWSIGDTVTVTRGTRRVPLLLGAFVDFQAVAPLASTRLAVLDIAQAQALFGEAGVIQQIDVRVRDDVTDLADRLTQRLGSSVRVVTPEQRREEAAGLLGAFRMNLTALSLISLFVGAFLVFASTQAGLVRRRSEFGVLRSLGASRPQVLGIILGDVLVLSLLGVALGVPLGYWVAWANVDVVSATLTNLYLLEAIERLQLPPGTFLLATAIGLVGALLGAIGPALDMSRRDPRALLAAFNLHEQTGRTAPKLFAAAWVVLLVTAIGFVSVGRGWNPRGFVLALIVVVSLAAMTPFLVQRVTWRLRTRGFDFRYSLKTLSARLQSTAVAVAALGTAVSMLVGITMLVGSFRRTLSVWMNDSVRADIYVAAESWRGRITEATLEDALVDALAEEPGVRAIDRLRSLRVYTGNRRIALAGVDIGMPGGASRFVLAEGSIDDAFPAMLGGAALISEPLARKEDLGANDSLRFTAPTGTVTVPVAGVYYDYSSEAGAAILDYRTLERLVGPGEFNSIAMYLEPTADVDDVVNRLRARYAETPLLFRSNRRLREEALDIFDQTFAVTRLLQVIALLIAAAGITLTLLVIARERVSELALYRALGATRRQIFTVFLGKGLGLAAMGLIFGILGGVPLAVILIYVVNPAYFGWTIQPAWPWLTLLGQFATIVAAAVLASIYPAVRASRVPATELSREDV